MDNIFNFEPMSNQLDDYLNNLITNSKINQHYEKTIQHTDYSKFSLSNSTMQEENTGTNSYNMCRQLPLGRDLYMY